jgi:hypothetical protein
MTACCKKRLRQSGRYGEECGRTERNYIFIIRNILITRNSIGLRRVAEGSQFPLKSIQMILRPTQLGFGITYPDHHAKS